VGAENLQWKWGWFVMRYVPPSSHRVEGLRTSLGVFDLDLSAALLDDGEYRTQPQWKESLADSPWSLIPGPVYWGLKEALFDNRDVRELAPLRDLLRQDERTYWMMTGSRVFYKPHGFDKVVHGWDTAEPTVVEANITGADGYLNDHMREALGALLGTDDVAKVNEVSEWLHGRPARLWRWNRKPKRRS
jgi:hypothetical protein